MAANTVQSGRPIEPETASDIERVEQARIEAGRPRNEGAEAGDEVPGGDTSESASTAIDALRRTSDVDRRT